MKRSEENFLRIYLRAFRVNQWIKNLVIFTALIFSGRLFYYDSLALTVKAFVIFCLLSSASYLINDIIDYSYDKKHPYKKNRPIASGQISIFAATGWALGLTGVSLFLAIFLSWYFFLLSLFFILLHFFYSIYLKRKPVADIFTISFSFMIRAYAGEVILGYHIPIWLILTIFFGSLFMASVKRHSELVVHGSKARESLYRYSEHFLDFLTYTFGTMTIIAYATYTYMEKPPQIETFSSRFFAGIFPGFEARKWMMITIPLVVYGIARYAQLLYERAQGEQPEKIVTTDLPLIVMIFLWGVAIISLIYLF